jgi:hypothetical protein
MKPFNPKKFVKSKQSTLNFLNLEANNQPLKPVNAINKRKPPKTSLVLFTV